VWIPEGDVRDLRKLKVWEKAHALTLEVDRVTGGFPRSEVLGLPSQLRRASASIAANIAEGCGRSSRAEPGQFLNQALGSSMTEN
jgi:four helix bundle protein